ncbi:hypothetical protein glysoja_028528 [Glycine soja]|uniref:Uncharacterized protein n=1 Tax=Glycine soja TaxID=3848 RepID=A0A0B2NXJ4_GLYSO|nr:hypothetical protein glysoja_028528 [Glycine soja]
MILGGLRVILTNQNKLVLAVCGVTALAAGRGLHCKVECLENYDQALLTSGNRKEDCEVERN